MDGITEDRRTRREVDTLAQYATDRMRLFTLFPQSLHAMRFAVDLFGNYDQLRVNSNCTRQTVLSTSPLLEATDKGNGS